MKWNWRQWPWTPASAGGLSLSPGITGVSNPIVPERTVKVDLTDVEAKIAAINGQINQLRDDMTKVKANIVDLYKTTVRR